MLTTVYRRLLPTMGLIVVSGSAANAQGLGNVNYLTQIQATVDTMVGSNIGLFIGEGQKMLPQIAMFLLAYMLIVALFSKVAAMNTFVEFVFRYLIAYSMLVFYDAPLPWLPSSSFHSIFADEARWIDGTIGLGVINSLTASLKNILHKTEVPIGINVLGFLTYMGVMTNIILLWVFSFGITAASYVALAVGSLMGPLFIPFLIWPFMEFLFTGWLRYMIIYMLWRVMATAVIAVFASVELWFINTIIGNNYSLGHLLACLPAWSALVIVCVYVLWISHSLARDMVSGSASMGNALSVVAGAAAASILR